MPCNGIAVLTFRLARQQRATEELVALVRPYLFQGTQPITDDNGITRMFIIMPMPDGSQMPIQCAVDLSGQVTLITQDGTFEQGQELLQRWLKALRSQQVALSGERFETHRHDEIAPELAYNMTQGQY